MSGIEVAGLVLGAFPLLLSALEKNREASQVFGDWYKVRKVYENCLMWVKAEYALFDSNIRGFLEPILCDTAKLEELLANPYGEDWRSDSLASEIKDFKYLPVSYESYIEVMQEFHNHMVALAEELGIDKPSFQQKIKEDANSGKGPSDARGLLQFEWHRIRFSVNRKRRAGLLAGLQKCNLWLERFSNSQRSSESPMRPSSNRRRPIHKSLSHFWQHAKAFTDLLLRDHKDFQTVEFTIMFTFAEKITTQHSGPWDWKEANIVAVGGRASQDSDEGSRTTTSAVSASSIHPPSAFRSTGIFGRSKKAKEVKFVDNVIPLNDQAVLLPPGANTQLPKVINLCHDLTTTGWSDTPMGVLGNDAKTYSITLPKQKSYDKSVLKHVTVHDILRSGLNKRFSRRQRYTIALAIASSYVQLHATPWIQAGWGKKDIYLLSIVTLGIMLLELAFGQALEDNAFRQKRPSMNGQPDPFVDKAAAEEWCLTSLNDEHPHFSDPVMWCLNHSTSRTTMDLEDETWRSDILSNVVQPLAECCEVNRFGVPEY
ncbi:hypothetical protein G7Y79_00007g022440 [Physcia stellaris]|nr:hypothetical protein G7Y79_00007g022440 [Physcia stellaris]